MYQGVVLNASEKIETMAILNPKVVEKKPNAPNPCRFLACRGYFDTYDSHHTNIGSRRAMSGFAICNALRLLLAVCVLVSVAAHAHDADKQIASLFDIPVATKIIPGKPSPNQGDEITCTYYDDFMIREVGTDSAAPDAASIIPVSVGSSRPACGMTHGASEIRLKSAYYSLVGRKGPFLLFSETDPNGVIGFIVIYANVGNVIYTDSMDNEMIKAVAIENGLLRLRFTRGVNGSCSLIKDANVCWAKMATEGKIPRGVMKRQPPIQACINAYHQTSTPTDDPSIVFYDVDMTLSTAGKTNVISRGTVECSPLP
jgi:hypothetical protein